MRIYPQSNFLKPCGLLNKTVIQTFAVLYCEFVLPEKYYAFGVWQVMITGDQALTACHVAAQVHIVTRPVLVLTQRSGDGAAQFDWLSPDEKIKMAYKYGHLPFIWSVELGAINFALTSLICTSAFVSNLSSCQSAL